MELFSVAPPFFLSAPRLDKITLLSSSSMCPVPMSSHCTWRWWCRGWVLGDEVAMGFGIWRHHPRENERSSERGRRWTHTFFHSLPSPSTFIFTTFLPLKSPDLILHAIMPLTISICFFLHFHTQPFHLHLLLSSTSP